MLATIARRGVGPLLGLGLLLSFGCGRSGKRAAAASTTADSYTVRGEIVSLPSAGGREALIRHEDVPSLRDASGKIVGMPSMTMPFPLDPVVDRKELAVGDRIEFVLEVRWSDRDPVLVTKITKLPPGTRLAFDLPQTEGETPR